MDAETFQTLALRMIAGEATADDRHALEAECAAEPARREAFQQWQMTHDILRTAAPMSEAMQAAHPELPAHRVNELRTAVRQHFGPTAARQRKATPAWMLFFRWLFAGAGFAAFGVAVVIVCFANKAIEVGVYGSDLVRGDERSLTAQDIPAARLITFEQDAPFDAWQDRPLAWNEHGKIWIDNEHDVLYIVQRINHGSIQKIQLPLAPTNEGQREQIQKAVDGMNHR